MPFKPTVNMKSSNRSAFLTTIKEEQESNVVPTAVANSTLPYSPSQLMIVDRTVSLQPHRQESTR
jgi:hypothetical protein